MTTGESLAALYQYNVTLVEKQALTLTHERSLILVGGYNINWLIGHVISARQRVLENVGLPHLWTAEDRILYRSGSQPPEKDGLGVQRLETLVATLHRSQTLIAEGLRRITPEQLAAPSDFAQDQSVLDRFLYFQYHESFHVGQIVLIAQTLGAAGVWLS